MPTFRLDIGYDGSDFHGYARNPGVRTIQGELESALSKIVGHEVKTSVAGRTDAGVHARGQVVSFVVGTDLDLERVERSLRSMLGPEIATESLTIVDDQFSARYSARARHYRYSVDDTPVADPLLRKAVWHVEGPLDVAAMNRAAAAFVGPHDFASLCRAQEGRTTERTVFDASWTRTDGLVVFEVVASAFCHQMVRSMVALCVDVGRGRLDADEVPAIIAALDRNAAGRGAAPPHGLVLISVDY